MFKSLSRVVYKILYIINFFTSKFFNKDLLLWLKEFIEEDSYKNLKIGNKKISFFVPNNLIKWRIETFFDKEPETIEWINNFDPKKSIFWDIGSNIGQYSIYCAIKHKKSRVVSFEPSAGNLRILSRNISKNGLTNKIKIFPIPLTKYQNKFFVFEESNFLEGAAHNNFGKDNVKDYNSLKKKMRYQIYGTNINYLLKEKILDIPNYIKIDVDGIESLILEGSENFLRNPKIKEVLIELDENNKKEYKKIIMIMKNNKFYLYEKKRNDKYHTTTDSKSTYNNIFKKL